jgi:hypothetical protein
MYEQLAKSIMKVTLTEGRFEVCKTFIQKKIRKNKLLLERRYLYILLLKKFYALIQMKKDMNTLCSLLLKAGGLLIYRVF